MEIKEFNLTYRPEGNIFPGVYIFIEKGALCDEVKKAFGRENQNLCLKVFRQPFTEDKVEDYMWGSLFSKEEHTTSLVEATKAQNIASWYGLAPRVYSIIVINFRGKKFLAQLTDFEEGEHETDWNKKKEVYDNAKNILEGYGFLPPVCDLGPNNVLNGKWIDWQGAKASDNALDLLKQKVKDNAYFVKGTHYQTQPEIGLEGFRDSEQRIKDLKLGDIDFTDRSVLDVGSCGGFFCNYAVSRGAKRVVGVDIPRNAEIARELSNWLGNWNIDYVSKTINKGETIKDFVGIKEFGIVLYLAVNWYLGFPDWYFNMSKDISIVEKNGKENDITNEAVESILKERFNKVQLIGYRTDFDKQPIYKCTERKKYDKK